MKRLISLCILLSILLVSVIPVQAAGSPIKSDQEGLLALQETFDAIASNLEYMGAEPISIVSFNLDFAAVQEQINAISDGQANQIYESEAGITLSVGVHYIDEEVSIQSITLLNNAVLFNLKGSIYSVSAKDESKYFGIGGGTASSLVLERHATAYLQGVSGERLTAGGTSEVFFFDDTMYPLVYALEESFITVIGNNVVISRAYVANTADFFDPNNRAAEVEFEEGRAEGGTSRRSGGGSRSGSGSKKSNDPYPPHIMEWVFNSKPQTDSSSWEVCGCGCGCGGYCRVGALCCEKCTCVHIRFK